MPRKEGFGVKKIYLQCIQVNKKRHVFRIYSKINFGKFPAKLYESCVKKIRGKMTKEQFCQKNFKAHAGTFDNLISAQKVNVFFFVFFLYMGQNRSNFYFHAFPSFNDGR